MSDWWFEDGGWRPHGLQDAWFDVNSPLAEAPPPADPYAATAKSPAWTDDGPQFSWNDEDDDVTEVDGITVTGNPITPWDGGGGGGGGGTGSPDSDVASVDPNSPADDWGCSDAPDGPTPTMAALSDVRAEANEVRRKIEAKTGQASGWEWGSLIYMDGSGQLHHTDPITSHSPHSIDGDIPVPAGMTIIAWVHSHPDGGFGDVNQSGLSRPDYDFRTDLLAALRAAGVSFDPNFMLYVIDMGEAKMVEFDIADGRNAEGAEVGPCA